MSDDIERIHGVVEALRSMNDTLEGDTDVLRDVMNAVTPIELETDPAGHVAIRNAVKEYGAEFARFHSLAQELQFNGARLYNKARIT